MSGINLKELKNQQKKVEASTSGSFDLVALLQKDIKLFPVKFTDKNKEAFYLELFTLLTAGLDIKAALDLIEAEQVKPKHIEIIRNIKENLINGDSLWEAMQKSPAFTPYEYFSVQIGEETGKLSVVLEQLYQFYQSKLKQRRQFIGALSYPIIILFTSIGAVSFMLLFIVPMFNDVFKRFGGDLPYLTQLIISFSTFLKQYFLLFALGVSGIGFFFYQQRKKESMRRFLANAVGRIPVIGSIVYSIQLARFSTSMSLLLGAKVPLIRSLNLISQMVTFYPIQASLPQIANDVMNGESLHTSMSKFKVYNRRMVSLVKVGEEVNKLDTFFGKLGTQFSSDVDHQTSLLNTFLEPAMIIFLGFAVGFILLAMYMPMFQLSTSIGG